MLPDQQTNEPFGIYIHWPFCESLCPYCDFNTYCSASIDQDQWCRAYLKQLEHAAGELEDNVCSSIYFGGGTPSLIDPGTVGRIIEKIATSFGLSPEPEITLEANPTTVEQDRFRQFRENGINRLSLGIQALNDQDLKALGRRHSVAEAIRAFKTADLVFSNVSLDFMFGRQYQTTRDWTCELHDILSLNPQHLSIYQLTIEPGTPFGQRHAAKRLPGLPDEDTLAEMYLATMDICAGNGYGQYEISNYAKPGFQGRHNLIYWEYHNFLGIGPGAHGRIKVKNQYYKTNTNRSPDHWLKNVFARGTGENLREAVDMSERGSEYLLTALRLNEGLNIARFEEISKTKLNLEAVRELDQGGWVKLVDGQLIVTKQGRLVLNQVITQLIP